MTKIEEALSKQIEVGKDLLQRARLIPDGTRDKYVYGFIKYGEEYTRPLSDDTDAWAIVTTEVLSVLFGEKSRRVTDFQACLRPKSNYTRFREDLQTDLKRGIAFLQALIKVDSMKQQVGSAVAEGNASKQPMVFISHSSKDIEFVEELVNLLESIGFNHSNLFCSSIPDYGIELSKDIFDSLLRLFYDYELFVIFVQSPRYYDSAISLNEMGAAWVLKNDFCSILTKDMTREKMRGVVSGDTIFIKVNTDNAPARMNELKDVLTKRFGLMGIPSTTWERKRNTFLKAVNAIEYAETPPKSSTVDTELIELQKERLRQEVEEGRKAFIQGEIGKGTSAVSRILTIRNSGKATARNINVEWLNPNDETHVQWSFGHLGELASNSHRAFRITLCKGSYSTMKLRYTWFDDYKDENSLEEELHF